MSGLGRLVASGRIDHQGEERQMVVRSAGETDVRRGDQVAVQVAGPLHAFGPDGARLGS